MFTKIKVSNKRYAKLIQINLWVFVDSQTFGGKTSKPITLHKVLLFRTIKRLKYPKMHQKLGFEKVQGIYKVFGHLFQK